MTDSRARLSPPLDADYSTLLAWLRENYNSGLLPSETALEIVITLFDKLNRVKPYTLSNQYIYEGRMGDLKDLIKERDSLADSLEVYKRAVKAMTAYIDGQGVGFSNVSGCNCSTCTLARALTAVNELENNHAHERTTSRD